MGCAASDLRARLAARRAAALAAGVWAAWRSFVWKSLERRPTVRAAALAFSSPPQTHRRARTAALRHWRRWSIQRVRVHPRQEARRRFAAALPRRSALARWRAAARAAAVRAALALAGAAAGDAARAAAALQTWATRAARSADAWLHCSTGESLGLLLALIRWRRVPGARRAATARLLGARRTVARRRLAAALAAWAARQRRSRAAWRGRARALSYLFRRLLWRVWCGWVGVLAATRAHAAERRKQEWLALGAGLARWCDGVEAAAEDAAVRTPIPTPNSNPNPNPQP